MPKVVYISGPITNCGTLPISDARLRFAQAIKELQQRYGCDTINPLDNEAEDHQCTGFTYWVEHMKVDIRQLLECDSIYMLHGWENSRGARLEHIIAESLGHEIIYQDTDENLKSNSS